MLNNFYIFEELVFFDLWIPDSGFRFPGFRVAHIYMQLISNPFKDVDLL